MITPRLKNLLLISIVLFIAHGVEEIYAGLWNGDSHVAFIFRPLMALPTAEGLFIVMQIMLWLLLVIGFMLLQGFKWQRRVMFILGIAFIYELHHLYKVINVGGYYPGIVTAIPLYIVGFYFWKEFIKNSKGKHIVYG